MDYKKAANDSGIVHTVLDSSRELQRTQKRLLLSTTEKEINSIWKQCDNSEATRFFLQLFKPKIVHAFNVYTINECVYIDEKTQI